jgi:type II secretory ATPase GspE/PulE/Tfp pilus assembly ATPase PilB-like protein
VRKLCVFCRKQYEPTDDELSAIGISREQAEENKVHKADGCKECQHIGYKGRTGIYELMTFNDELRDLVLQEASTGEIAKVAVASGMQTLRGSGIKKVLAGITTIEEVLSETVSDD